MLSLVVWDTDESMPETVTLDATSLTAAMKEADASYPKAYSLIITKAGDMKSLANREPDGEWLGKWRNR